MKKILSILALFVVAISFGQTLETFSYTGVLNANGWSTHSGTSGQLVTSTGSLSYTGLAASTGNKAVLSESNSEDVNMPITITGDTAYLSFIVSAVNTSDLSTGGDYFIGIGSGTGSSAGSLYSRIYVKSGTAANTVNFGIGNASGAATFDVVDYAIATPVFITVSLDKNASPTIANMYINVTPGAAMPASPTITNSVNTSAISTFGSVFIREGGSTGNLEIDEIRAGSTFASVTPASVAGCNIAASGLASLTCNDATTGSDPSDDYLTFDLDPTGSMLGTTYTVSVASGTITPTTGTYGAATSFQLQAGSAGAGNVAVTITDNGTSGCTLVENITDPGACSSATPVITLSPSALTGFDFVAGTPSPEQTFTASGLGLTGDITLTAPANYFISLTAGTGFNPTLTLAQTAGVVSPTTIYVIGYAPTMGMYIGDIVGTSPGAVNDSVNVSGYVSDYVYSTIDAVTTVNANGVANSMNELVELTGVVHCIDFDGNSGYSITLIDGSTEGINLFSFNDVSNYTNPLEGDSVRVFGVIGQYNGLLQVAADSIELLAQGAALVSPTTVTVLDESTESQVIRLDNLTFVTPITTFPTGSNNIDVTDGTNTFTIRIDSDTDIPGGAAPQGTFSVIGVGGQFDNSSPYTDGYQLFPCSLASFLAPCTAPSNAVTLTDTTTAIATATGMNITYQWINCSANTPIAGATAQSYTATATGDYAVIVMDGPCSDTSNCVYLVASTIGLDENTISSTVNVYPNPSNTGVYSWTKENNEATTITITDVSGRVIETIESTSTEGKINLSTKANGTYYVIFTTENTVSKALLIKQ